MTRSTAQRVGSALLAATGALHLVLAPEYLEEQAYIGVLFILGGLTALVVAARLWRRDDQLAWLTGGLIAAGMAVGFILSRTVGLPGFHEHEWEGSGILSLFLEGGFLVTLVAALKPAPRPVGP